MARRIKANQVRPTSKKAVNAVALGIVDKGLAVLNGLAGSYRGANSTARVTRISAFNVGIETSQQTSAHDHLDFRAYNKGGMKSEKIQSLNNKAFRSWKGGL